MYLSAYEKDQSRKKYGRNNLSGYELDLARNAKKKVAKKMKVKHSDDRMGFYRSFKDKEDYTKGHIKAQTIRPKKGSKKEIYEYVKRHHDDLLKGETSN